MKRPAAHSPTWRWRRAVALLAAAFMCSAAFAARETRLFSVTVNLSPAATCLSSSSGSQASVGCKVLGQESAFPTLFLQVYRGGYFVADVLSGMSSGTITSWRVVRSAEREYLEVMVAW